MKTCSRCKITFDLSNFYQKYKNKNYLRPECKSCFNEIVKENYRKIKQQMVEYKGGKCSKCGYYKYYGALEFHHLDPKYKESKLSKATSFNSFKEELDKCILLCANCHRETHAQQEWSLVLDSNQ